MFCDKLSFFDSVFQVATMQKHFNILFQGTGLNSKASDLYRRYDCAMVALLPGNFFY